MSFGISGDINTFYPVYSSMPVDAVSRISGNISGTPQTDATTGVHKTECQTCKSRKYQDGSNDGNVSFKAPGHISPEASASVVRAHEGEHVANAIKEGNQEGNRLINASVSLQVAICPECGRSYVAGGTTTTTIAYNESNPYEQSRKSLEGSFLAGQNIDLTA